MVPCPVQSLSCPACMCMFRRASNVRLFPNLWLVCFRCDTYLVCWHHIWCTLRRVLVDRANPLLHVLDTWCRATNGIHVEDHYLLMHYIAVRCVESFFLICNLYGKMFCIVVRRVVSCCPCCKQRCICPVLSIRWDVLTIYLFIMFVMDFVHQGATRAPRRVRTKALQSPSAETAPRYVQH